MTTTLRQIDPASGPLADYADVATWEAALGSGDQVAECWNTGDLGGLTLNDTDPQSVTVRERAGHMHNGTLASLLTSARALSLWTIARDQVTVRGLAFRKSSGSNGFAVLKATTGTWSNIVIDAVLAHSTNTTTAGCITVAISSIAAGGTAELNIVLRNCVVYMNGANSQSGLNVGSTQAGVAQQNHTVNVSVLNCTARQLGSQTGTIGVRVAAVTNTNTNAASTSVVNATVRNVAAFNFATDFAKVETPGSGTATVNLTASNNASADATADDFGGSGHLVGQTAGDWFANPAADLRKSFASPGIRAGFAIAANPRDFRRRRREGRYDIGFDQFHTLGDARARRLLACRE